MGLDCSHDCWHGPYSQFMRWRQWLNRFVMGERGDQGDAAAQKIGWMGATREAVEAAWEQGMYEDQSLPINVLMAHSDCEGEIAPEVCGPLADELQRIAEKFMPPRGTYDEMRPATERFVAGLRRAAANDEPVRFG
jgi:hypothetical protein